jgi:hypothetical protein
MLKSGVFFMTLARPNFYNFLRYKTEIPQFLATNNLNVEQPGLVIKPRLNT